MYNIMRYHTSDNRPLIQVQHTTKAAAQKELRQLAKGEKATKAGADRYEHKGKGYGIALYIEKE